MKSISASLKSHLQGEVTTLATCWKITRSDGIILGFTDHDEDVTISSVLYEAATGFTPTTIQSNESLSVDNLETDGLIDSSTVTDGDLIAGLYDYADVEIFMVNYASVTSGLLLLKKGTLGEVTVKQDQFRAEVRSLSQKLQQTIGEVFSANCRADLGDARCGITLEPNDWQEFVSCAVGNEVLATDYDGRRYVCSTAGISDHAAWSSSAIFNITLSNNNYDAAEATTSATGVIGNRALSGNRYWEIVVGSLGTATASSVSFGIHNSQSNVKYTDVAGSTRIDGNAFASVVQTGDRIMFAVNASAGLFWVGKNGVWLDGNPTAGTSAYATVAAASTWYPWFGTPNESSAISNNIAAAFASADMLYTIPSTFSAISAEPVWNTGLSSTTADNTAIWTTYDAYLKEGVVTSVIDNGDFIDTGRTEVSAVFDGGKVTWVTGNNVNRSMEVKRFQSSGAIKLFQKMGYAIVVGDTYKIVVGCDKTVPTCKTFAPENGARGNIYNYRGEPYIPSTDKVGKFGGQ